MNPSHNNSIHEKAPSQSESTRPLKVFVTVDVELWPRSWEGHHQQFTDCYNRYIYGRTHQGSFGLPFQLEVARDHGLNFVCFVESLFACDFGLEPLKEIVHTIQSYDQEIQLHAHPEWITHSSVPIIDTRGRFVFRDFSENEQFRLVETGLANIRQSGVENVHAFRAGSFAANAETLAAVSRAGIPIDSSFKQYAFDASELRDSTALDSVREYPLTTYEDWPGRHRNLQLGACSFLEIEHVLREAHAAGWASVVILSHSAELLNRDRSRPARNLVRRFERVCRLLADSSEFRTGGFAEEARQPAFPRQKTIKSARWRTGLRVLEHATSRLFA